MRTNNAAVTALIANRREARKIEPGTTINVEGEVVGCWTYGRQVQVLFKTEHGTVPLRIWIDRHHQDLLTLAEWLGGDDADQWVGTVKEITLVMSEKHNWYIQKPWTTVRDTVADNEANGPSVVELGF